MNLRIYCLLAGVLFLSTIALAEDTTEEEKESVSYAEDVDGYEYSSPEIPVADKEFVYFSDHFDDEESFKRKWVLSQAKKEGIEEDISKYDGEWLLEEPVKDGLSGDMGLVLKTKAKHAAISAKTKPVTFANEPVIIQYEVQLQEGQECGGAYLKLLSENSDLKQFTDKSPYSVMFGPDKCGNDYKLHFIFRHRNPLNGTVEEKHCQKPKVRLEEIYDDKLPHLYTLIMNPDNSFEIKIDNKVVNSGSLLEDFAPPVNPPAEIEDPADQKPEDWDEREKIPDPEATRPDDWDEDAPPQIVDEAATMPAGWLHDEPTHVPDPDATKPADWDTEMDGEWEPALIENPACEGAPGCGAWEPPLINNPKFKGKWRAPFIDNPNYKGKWRPRKVPNPDYFEDKHPFRLPTINAIGFELWSMSKDILFDNIIITSKEHIAEYWAEETFTKKRQKIAYESESLIQKLANFTNDYPMMWGVYIAILGIPVVLLLYCCFKPSSATQAEKEELRREAEKKKTDEATEDNAEVEAEEDGDDEDAEKNSEPDSDDDNEAVEESVPEKSSGDAPRKRKVRKD